MFVYMMMSRMEKKYWLVEGMGGWREERVDWSLHKMLMKKNNR